MTPLKLDNTHLIGTSGSGNQKKAWIGNTLIKVNSKYREASKEVDAAIIAEAFKLNHANYREITVDIGGSNRNACITDSFLNSNEVEITVAEILDLSGIIITMNTSALDYINMTIKVIHDFTKLPTQEIIFWIYSILVFDFLICNNDRHLSNLEIIKNENTGNYRPGPIYDNGQSFLLTDANLTINEYHTKLQRFKTKPFSTNPIKNLGDKQIYSKVFLNMMDNANGINGIRQLNISSGHKLTLLRQVEKLYKLIS